MRLLPRSLLGRVFALYAITLVLIAGVGLAMFLAEQVQYRIQDARQDGKALLALVAPTVADAAVIGDYDSIKRQLQSLTHHSLVRAVEFVDPAGGMLRAADEDGGRWSPSPMRQWVADQLGRPVQSVAAGGRAYGELRLTLAAPVIAGVLWHQAIDAIVLALVGVAGGMLLIRPPLARWLGPLERIGRLGSGLEGGRDLARAAISADAPLEFRRTFEVLDLAASSLQAQREQAAATLQAIDDAVLACNLEGRVVLANEAAQRLLGRAIDTMVGQPLVTLLAPLADDLPDQAGDQRWQHRRVNWTDAAGRDHVLDANRSFIVAADGQPVGLVLACRDVTEAARRDAALRELNASRDAALASLRHALEDSVERGGLPLSTNLADIEAVSQMVSRLVVRLHERSEQLDAIFALSPDGFVSFDAEHRVTYCSPGFSRLTGLSREMVVGLEEDVFLQRLRQRVQKTGRQGDLDRLRDAAHGGERVTVHLARPENRVLSVALHVGRAQAVSQVLHLRDVTRETEVDRMKSEFLAAAAHELRTPMVGIYGYSELLFTRELPPERAKSLLGRIHRQCEVMVSILNEMLDLARLEARQGSDFVLAPVTMDEVVDAALSDFAPPPERAPPWRVPGGASLRSEADKAKLQRVLRNLLSNAYKYSPAGGDVVVRVVQDVPRQRVGIEVEDHGIGMTAAQLQHVGERFYRADASGAVLGTGLGMSLAFEIAALHGGEIALRSTPGEGTVATLWLPAWHGSTVADSAPALTA